MGRNQRRSYLCERFCNFCMAIVNWIEILTLWILRSFFSQSVLLLSICHCIQSWCRNFMQITTLFQYCYHPTEFSNYFVELKWNSSFVLQTRILQVWCIEQKLFNHFCCCLWINISLLFALYRGMLLLSQSHWILNEVFFRLY